MRATLSLLFFAFAHHVHGCDEMVCEAQRVTLHRALFVIALKTNL